MRKRLIHGLCCTALLFIFGPLRAGAGETANAGATANNADAHLAPLNKDGTGYWLSGTELAKRIQWGGWFELPDGTGLLFGGLDQGGDDGNPHTQIKQGGKWVSIRQELCDKNPLQKLHDQAKPLCVREKNAAARLRFVYFSGLTAADEAKALTAELAPLLEALGKDIDKLAEDLKTRAKDLKDYDGEQAGIALGYVEKARGLARPPPASASAEAIKRMGEAQICLELAAEALDAEPPPRTLSPVVYDTKTKLFVVVGGDHLDYLTNDTWVFDATQKKWKQRHPKAAPPPRANHTLTTSGDGRVVLSGGYTYANRFEYMTGQYKDIGGGDWTYDLAASEWSGGAGVAADSRVYRSGAFHPDFFMQGPKPNAAENEARLKALPVNAWADLKPPQTLMLNRDWGTAVLDSDRDMLLRWSGGHSSHGGSDVPHYHLATNRWELPIPVEFPLGSLFSNTGYPAGYNFNGRPWITGHTYRSYCYDPLIKKMVSTGRPWIYGAQVSHQDLNFYTYDPDIGDWITRAPKPPDMCYSECYYTLTLCSTPKGAFLWNKDGKIFKLDGGKTWSEVKLSGTHLPGTAVDGACLVYDSKRDRLLGIQTAGYQKKYEGEVYAIDMKSFECKALNPAGKAGVGGLEFIREASYDSAADLMLLGAPLPGRSDELALYDCAGNRWVSAKFPGADFLGKTFNISLGLSYDARRNLHWAVGQYGDVHALRIDTKTAGLIPLEGK